MTTMHLAAIMSLVDQIRDNQGQITKAALDKINEDIKKIKAETDPKKKEKARFDLQELQTKLKAEMDFYQTTNTTMNNSYSAVLRTIQSAIEGR